VLSQWCKSASKRRDAAPQLSALLLLQVLPVKQHKSTSCSISTDTVTLKFDAATLQRAQRTAHLYTLLLSAVLTVQCIWSQHLAAAALPAKTHCCCIFNCVYSACKNVVPRHTHLRQLWPTAQCLAAISICLAALSSKQACCTAAVRCCSAR
jgi:hypothetical protein